MAVTVKSASSKDELYRKATDSTDYQSLIDRAVSDGDYRSAAQYEQQRNSKIDAMDALGLNPNGYSKSNQYSSKKTHRCYVSVRENLFFNFSANIRIRVLQCFRDCRGLCMASRC